MLHPLLGILLVLTALGSLIGGIWAVSRLRPIDAEVSRKLVHVGMGLLVLTFPWLFQQVWPVLVLAGLAIVSLLALRLGSLRTAGPGNVLLGVERSTLGDVYFPVSVALLFLLANGDPMLYCIPLLVLTVADASAALIGKRWGRHPYTSSDHHKTYEGSLAFLAVAFASVFIPLVALGELHWYPAALVSATIGLIVTALEAISLSGRDNLYIPFAVFVLLKLYLPLTPESLWVRLLMLLAVLGLVILLRARTTLDDAALLGAALTGYAAFAIGGWPWLAPPVLLLLAYTRLYPNCYPEGRGAHNIHAVVSVTAGGYLCLLMYADTGRPGWYLPYAISYGAQLAMIGVASFAITHPKRPLNMLVLKAAMFAAILICLLLVAVGYYVGRSVPLVAYLVTAVSCSGAALLFAIWQPQIRDCPVDLKRWLRQGLLGVAMSVPAILLVEAEL